jgi:hypothetical protein
VHAIKRGEEREMSVGRERDNKSRIDLESEMER